jgi:hypothetical protein
MRGDSPPFKMKVVGDKLAPATAWDSERLASYRSGAEVSVVITQEVASWARRRYWAILGVVVKTCPVPPRVRTAQDLHDAIRKQIGFVDSHTSDGQRLTVKLRSTSKLDDQQFEAFAAEAYAELTAMTGVDVLTLGREAPDVGPQYEQPDDRGASVTGSGSGEASQGTAPDDSAAADLKDAGDQGIASDQPASDAHIIAVKKEMIAKALYLAHDKTLPDPTHRREALAMAKDSWKETLPDHLEFVRAVFVNTDAVIRGKQPTEKVREYLEGLV